MSGNDVNETCRAREPARLGERIFQVFVFFRGQFVGYQCFLQERVTIGGSPGADLYLPSCSPEEGTWNLELAGGTTLVAWLGRPEKEGQEKSKPQRRAVEPLDVFPIGEYRFQVKVLSPSGFMQPDEETKAERDGNAPHDPGAAAVGSPLATTEAGELSVEQTQLLKSPLAPLFQRGGEESAPLATVLRSGGEEAARVADAEAQAPAAGAARTSVEVTQECRETNPSPPCTGERDGVRGEQEQIHPSSWPSPLDEGKRDERIDTLLQRGGEGSEPAVEDRLPETPEESLEAEEEADSRAGGDEEEEDGGQGPYFSLVKTIFRNLKQTSRAADPAARALEIVRFKGGDVHEVAYLEDGSYAIRKGWSRKLWKEEGGPPPGFRMVQLRKGGPAELRLREGVRGRLYSHAGSRDILDLLPKHAGAAAARRPRKPSLIRMPADTWAVLRVEPFRYLVRYVPRKPRPLMEPMGPRVTKSHLKLASASLVSHVLLLLLIGLTIPRGGLEGYVPKDQFAKVDPNILKNLKRPEPPKPAKPIEKPLARPEPKQAPPPKQKQLAAKPKEIPKVVEIRRQPAPETPAQTQPSPEKKVDVAKTGLLAALDTAGPAGPGTANPKGQGQILLAAVTNLDAVNVPSDSTTFNLAGIAGKLGTSEIQIPTGDAIRTVGAQELIKSSNGMVGALASKGTGSGQVKAVVREPPKAAITIRGGMSREAVLGVVNRHIDEIRDCYERELLHNPGLTGKILMEWLIRPDGSVSYAKVTFTNIGHSSDLHLCVQAQVAAWQFPRPTDSQEVVVTFPFLFENAGF
ncbi:MAG: AgmX/PglI C-terminal domain-containing protein [bacterium]